jgi:hypothetical protein
MYPLGFFVAKYLPFYRIASRSLMWFNGAVNKCSEAAMSRRLGKQSKTSSDLTVFVGAHIPLKLYRILVEEAEQAEVTRSEMLRRVLGERYGAQQATEGRE